VTMAATEAGTAPSQACRPSACLDWALR
jgi:hypothetical protein